MQIAGNDEQQVITIDDGAGVIDHQYPITITIEGDTQVRMLGQNGGLQRPHMRGTAVIVDVQPVRLSGKHDDFGTQFTEDARRYLIGRTMRAVDNDLQTGEIGPGRHAALAELDVAARCIIDSRHLTDLARLDDGHWRIQQLFDHQLQFIGQLGTFAGEELDAVVIMRVVRSTDHDAGFSLERTRQISDGRRRHRAEQHHIGTRRGQARFECRFKHITGDPRVLADKHLASTHLAESHAGRPAELEHEVRRDRVFTNATANAVGTKIFLAHKCSIILIRLILRPRSFAQHRRFPPHRGPAIYVRL